MPSVFLLTVRFLDPAPAFHGRGDGGDPEWPPSPLRLFQALVCAAAGRWREGQLTDYAFPALHWLEQQREPTIIAPDIQVERTGFRMYVPNNAGDLVTAAWARGNDDTKFSTLNVEKDVLPTRLIGGDSIHYLWEIPDDVPEVVRGYLETLAACARSITHLGWGVDMVAANAKVVKGSEAAAIQGHIWTPVPTGGTPLRVPLEGTLKGLQDRHGKFLTRLSGEAFAPVPPLSNFHTVGYHCPTAPSSKPAAARPWVAFRIDSADPDGKKPSFDPARKGSHVAAWLRHATAQVCRAWPYPDFAEFIHGHDPADENKPLKGDGADARFQYLPLPSVERRGDRGIHIGAIRRVLIAAPHGFRDRIDWIARRLPGNNLEWEGDTQGMLNTLIEPDWVLEHYTKSARAWSTVTPVVLPGYDDRNAAKTEELLRRAFLHAGISQDLIDGIVDLSWRQVGFRAGLDLARNYTRPDKLTGSTHHVRVEFAHAVRGPLAEGAGRYRGLGLFAIEEK